MDKNISFNQEIRPATKQDLLVARSLLKTGQPFYLLNSKTGKLSGVHVITVYTNSDRLEKLFNAKSIYVPVLEFNNDIIYDLQQKELEQLVNKKYR